MNKNYNLREKIWNKFYSRESIEKFENYTYNLLNSGKTESEIKTITSQYENEYWNELKKLGLYPEDKCILYGDYDIDVDDSEFTIYNEYIDYEYFEENDELISFPLNKDILGMLINDLLKYDIEKNSIKNLKISQNNSQKPYIIKEFTDHIHLSTIDQSDFIPIAIFSTKLTHIVKKLFQIYTKKIA
ncbi:hypothetical protein LCGC14_0971350 [marine sediment metagenome]|uniref:Uncharacterized protein n=1 Tax=marine sediment metagenome TaxID=412755 RepID=A0A0F9QUS7_9ZZZZ